MRKYVFTVREDIMLKESKTEDMLAKLIGKMNEYGTVEEYDTVINRVSAEKDDELINLKAAYDNAKLRDVTDEEAEVINKIRDIAEKLANTYKVKYDNLKSRVSVAQLQAKQKREIAKRQLEEADKAMAAIGLDVDTAE